ncbi:MAG TPA: zf-HC2 domain-containing protein, partial [Gemmatimonadaceae bacterium]
MTHEVIRHLLDDYVTGDLTEDARAPVSEHVAGCAICRSEVESLQKIIARAAELPRSIEPPSEAWAGIRAAIERDKLAVGQIRPLRDSGVWRRPSMMAAAIVLAAVLSSVGTAVYMNGRA